MVCRTVFKEVWTRKRLLIIQSVIDVFMTIFTKNRGFWEIISLLWIWNSPCWYLLGKFKKTTTKNTTTLKLCFYNGFLKHLRFAQAEVIYIVVDLEELFLKQKYCGTGEKWLGKRDMPFTFSIQTSSPKSIFVCGSQISMCLSFIGYKNHTETSGVWCSLGKCPCTFACTSKCASHWKQCRGSWRASRLDGRFDGHLI